MKLLIHRIMFLLLLLPSFSSDAQMMQLNEKDVFINGINLPWRYFGKDFGGTARERYDTTYFENTFRQLEENGVNALRIWLHCDARHSPTFNRNGLVEGLPRTFIEDFLDFLTRAEQHGVLIMPVLWTFELADRSNRNGLLNSVEILQSYIDNALIPLIEATKDRCNILAWEIMNEPEWAMDIPYAGTTNTLFSANEIQRFVGLQAHAIHTHSDHKVTVGSAGLRFINDQYFRSHNYWHDIELQAENVDCEGAYLDFYSVHYYKWKLEPLSPFKQSCESFNLDKPVVIGEFGKSKKKSTSELIQLAHENGYAGTMPWSMNANDGVGKWTDYQEELNTFASEQKSLMPSFPLCVSTDLSPSFISCRLFPNPTQHILNIDNPNPGVPVGIELISAVGNISKKWTNQSGPLITLSVSDCPAGIYIARISSPERDGTIRQRSRQKIMIVR